MSDVTISITVPPQFYFDACFRQIEQLKYVCTFLLSRVQILFKFTCYLYCLDMKTICDRKTN